ncbi:MAG: type III-A CRISPR-associated protein Cas10/Csm1 [Halobacteriota archaeon]
MEEKIIQLAALLHDIGKFWQGTGERGKHAELSSRFIREYVPEQWQGAAGIVALHHEPKVRSTEEYRAVKTIICADWLSSGERRGLTEEEEKGERKGTPLKAIFCEIDIGKGDLPPAWYYPIKKLELKKEVIFPKPLEGKGEYRLQKDYIVLWGEFLKEVEQIKVITDFDAYFNTLYNLLQKYTWCVPSAVYRNIPDVSLFDHLKTSCAIASCLYEADENYLDKLLSALEKRWRNEELSEEEEIASNSNKFLLIGGDISGIQKFIYSISSPEEARKGMAKRLRGRSFYLNLLNDAIATHIISRLGLPQTNILWCGGGHFTILAPCNENVIADIKEIKKDVNTQLLNKFDGALALALDWIEASSKDFEDFSTLKERLSVETNRAKRQKFVNDLSINLFKPRGEVINKVCAVCGMKSKGTFCERCEEDKEIGGAIAKAKYILKIEGSGLSNCDVIEFDVGYSFVESKDKIARKMKEVGGQISQTHMLRLNNTDFLKDNVFNQLKSLKSPVSLVFSFLGNIVPLYRGLTLDFGDIADLSKGANKLGILKMDVDNLGKIFAFGLPREDRTISRISTLSSMLDVFFGGYLNKIAMKHCVYANLCDDCAKKVDGKKREIKIETGEKVYDIRLEFEDELCNNCKSENNRISKVYMVYSGGDDLLMVGPWDTIIEFGKDIRDGFKDFTCNSESLNISGGVFICGAKYPVGRAISIADDNVDLAKSHLKEKNDRAMKNSIALFNECVCWDDLEAYQKKGFKSLFELANILENLCEKKMISKGFVYSLLRMWGRSFDKFEGDIRKIENNRITQHSHVPLLKYQIARTVKDKKEREDIESKIKPCMPWIRIPVSWVSLRMR